MLNYSSWTSLALALNLWASNAVASFGFRTPCGESSLYIIHAVDNLQ